MITTVSTTFLGFWSLNYMVAGRWFSPGTPVCSTNKTDRHTFTEILSKVALNTITLTLIYTYMYIQSIVIFKFPLLTCK